MSQTDVSAGSSVAPSASGASAASSSAGGAIDDAVLQSANDLDSIEQEQIQAQQDAIASEQSQRLLVGPLEPLSQLEGEYASNPKFLHKIQTAARGPYPQFRRIRGDGNCFFRGYVFAILEWMSRTLREEGSASEADRSAVSDVVQRVSSSLESLVAQGFDRFTMEDFHECFLEQFEWVRTERPSADQIVERLADEGLDQYCVAYARYLTSAYLQTHADEYAPFVSEGRSVAEFRRTEIEPMNREADSLQIVCLSNLLGVGVRVCYLDQSASGSGGGSGGVEAAPAGAAASGSASGAEESMRTYDFPEGSQARVHLLYRPGHFDVLAFAPQHQAQQ